MDPDALVRARGEPVEHEWVATAAFDTDYNLDEDASTVKTAELPAVVSNPSEEAFKRLEGRGSTPTYELTVPSDADVQADRDGRPDRFRVRDSLCKVVEVRRDRHPVAGVEKKTVLVSGLDGR